MYPTSYRNEFIKNWLMIGAICIIIAISPIMALFFAIIFYRQQYSFPFFILFAFYFGWFYEPQLDLLNHYNHFKTLIGKNLFEAWVDTETIHLGREPYPVLFKYIVGQISVSPNFFSACACSIYAMLFTYGVMGSIRDLYIQKKNLPALVILIGIIFIVEYNWFLGLRFWSGAFVFIAFYIRYVRTSNTKYLFLSFLCVCFHFSLFTLCVIAVLNWFLKDNFKVRYILIVFGWIIRYIQIPVTAYVANLSIMDGLVKESFRNKSIVQSVTERMDFFRTEGNLFYMIRNDILFFNACFVLFVLWRLFGKKVFSCNPYLWGLILIAYAFTNIGYADLIFYGRFYKVTLLLLYMYIFMCLIQAQNEISVNIRLWMAALLFIPILYAIATIAISQREFLWKIKIWFNTFFF